MMGVDPEDFARQMDYVSRLSKLVAPRAFSFLEDTILFTGNDPFSSEELAGLLPTQVECYEDYEAPQDARFSVVVVGQTDFSKDLIRSVVDRSSFHQASYRKKASWMSCCSATIGGARI